MHLAIEPSFRPAEKAHPVFAVMDLGDLERYRLAGD
jgi:hypothetical protein